MPREIVKYGSRVLRQTAAPVASVDTAVLSLIDDLFDSMHEAGGIGLAAPQIGVSQRVIVVDISSQVQGLPPTALANPEILRSSGSATAEEGCLSLPELYADVERKTWIEVEALDIRGQSVRFEATDFFARVLQHEIDHLDGTLFIDRISPLKRQLMRGALRRLKKEGRRWDDQYAGTYG